MLRDTKPWSFNISFQSNKLPAEQTVRALRRPSGTLLLLAFERLHNAYLIEFVTKCTAEQDI